MCQCVCVPLYVCAKLSANSTPELFEHGAQQAGTKIHNGVTSTGPHRQVTRTEVRGWRNRPKAGRGAKSTFHSLTAPSGSPTVPSPPTPPAENRDPEEGHAGMPAPPSNTCHVSKRNAHVAGGPAEGRKARTRVEIARTFWANRPHWPEVETGGALVTSLPVSRSLCPLKS